MRKVLVALTLAACLALPSSAGAATVFGADLSQTPSNSTSQLSVVNVISPGGAVDNGAPVGGILVSVRIKTRGPAGDGVIRLLQETAHPAADTWDFFSIPPEISVPFPADAGTGVVTQVLTRRPIAAGTRLGWFTNDPLGNVDEQYNDPSGECAYTGSHLVGTTQTYSSVGCNHNILLTSGTIEADADGDGFGDETQDGCPGNPAAIGACPVPVPCRVTSLRCTFPSPVPPKKCKKKKRGKGAAAAKKKCKKKR